MLARNEGASPGGEVVVETMRMMTDGTAKMIKQSIQTLAVLGIAVGATLASVQDASAGWPGSNAGGPARGYIDARWNSGYLLRGQDHHPCGRFALCPGCSCLTPNSYRSFAPLIVPRSSDAPLGGSWYTGNPWYSANPVPVPTAAEGGEVMSEASPAPDAVLPPLPLSDGE